MLHGKVILQLLSERIKKLTQLKELLLGQQRALVQAHSEEVTRFARLQLECMEKIQTLEERWTDLVNHVKKEKALPTASTDLVVSLGLNDNDSARVFAYLDQVKKLAGEIQSIRRNNALLIHNSLGLVNATLRKLQGEGTANAVYSPFRKLKQRNILLNKKM